MKYATRLLAVLALGGCSDPLTPEEVAGVYEAIEFNVILNSVPTNLLASGATVSLELKSDGTTAGRFVLPVVPGVQTTPVDDDLSGTWTLQNGVVRLDQDDDTYLRDFLFVAATNELRASQVISTPTIQGNLRLVLSK